MKKRIQIYIDDGVWNSVKQEAYRRGAGDINKAISASQFTEDALVAFMERGEVEVPVTRSNSEDEKEPTDDELREKLQKARERNGINDIRPIERPKGMTNAAWQIYRTAQENKRRAS